MKPAKVIVYQSPTKVLLSRIEEATRKSVGNYTARRDQPHFQGDEIHAHCELPGGREVAWTITGKRRHPNKFPADNKIPRGAKEAIASALGIDPSIFEAYQAFDELEQEFVFILTIRETPMTLSEIEQAVQNRSMSCDEIRDEIDSLSIQKLMLHINNHSNKADRDKEAELEKWIFCLRAKYRDMNCTPEL